MSDIILAHVNIPILNKDEAASAINAIPLSDAAWFYDKYRNAHHIPLMTFGGKSGAMGAVGTYTVGATSSDYKWTPFVPTVIRNWFDDVVFPWMGSKARVSIMRTESGVANNEHIDTVRAQAGTRQHKFRCVLQGETDTLYFKTSSGDVFAPELPGAYILEGGWPHGMINRSPSHKLTITVGSPWTGRDDYAETLSAIYRTTDYQLPEDMEQFYSGRATNFDECLTALNTRGSGGRAGN